MPPPGSSYDLGKGFPVLRDDINNALKEAMKAKNERAVSTLRMVNSTLKNADIEARGGGKSALGEPEVHDLVERTIRRTDAGQIELLVRGLRRCWCGTRPVADGTYCDSGAGCLQNLPTIRRIILVTHSFPYFGWKLCMPEVTRKCHSDRNGCRAHSPLC